MRTGEVTRYLSTYGSAMIDRAVLIGPIPPYLSQAPDNPDGVAADLFDGFRQQAAADTPAWLKGFLGNFYNIDQLGGDWVSDEAYRASFNVAVSMSAIAAHACIATWQADFREDLPKIDVPVLVIQGDADRILPFDKTGRRLSGLIADMELVVIEGGPHAIPWTHADEVNAALLRFLGHSAA
jgi:non-heme chloroperoxidase